MPSRNSAALFRQAHAGDAAAIAQLHADSWRRNYRGAYLDSYLDGDILTERRAVWTGRLSGPKPSEYTIVAESDGTLLGFAHTVFHHDDRWGALLDNLHVTHDRKRGKIGTGLMAETARAVLEATPRTGLYLWVLEQNTAAQAFYEARRGTRVERKLRGPFPGGGEAFGFRYAWSDPADLITDAD